MATPLMPKATALWLVDNTTLSFEQIAQFCDLHVLEVQAIADGEIAGGLSPYDPLLHHQLTREEIARCEKDTTAHLTLLMPETVITKTKGGHYTALVHRKDRPDGIAWMLRNHPEVSDTALCRLLGTTRATIEAVRNRTHWNTTHIKPRSPATIGLCSQRELDAAILSARAHRKVVEEDDVTTESSTSE